MLSAFSTSYYLILAPTLWLREPCTHCSDRKTEVKVLVQGHKVVLAAVELRSHVWLFVSSWTAACQASLSFIISWNLLKLMSIELVMPSNHLILCHPLLLLPSIFSTINVFSNESVLHIRRPKYWSFSSASVPPMNIQNWFPLGITGLMSLLSKGFSRVFSDTMVQKHQFFGAQPSLWSNSQHGPTDAWIYAIHIPNTQGCPPAFSCL